MGLSFKPTVLEEVESEYSGKVQVVKGWGFKHLSTENIQHSGGIVEEIWMKALKKYAVKESSWLVLGVAGGTVINLISTRYKPTRIVGVEIDPVVIALGKKYFGLDDIMYLEIVVEDANRFVCNQIGHFGFVLCDLFEKDAPPAFVYEDIFLKRLKESGDIVFVNHLYDTVENKAKAEALVQKIKSFGFEPVGIKVKSNIVIKY